MKTPLLVSFLPHCSSFTAASLAASLRGLPYRATLKILTALKETSVRDQNFEQAQTFRVAAVTLEKMALPKPAPVEVPMLRRIARPQDKHAGPMKSQWDVLKATRKAAKTAKRR